MNIEGRLLLMIKWYNLWELYNHDLFDNIQLPAGIDKETLINTIYQKCAMYSPLYHEHDLLVNMIDSWFIAWYDTFKRMVNALNEEYNPLHNYDRYEKIDRTFTHTGHRTEDETNINSDISTVQTSAFDSSDWQNSDKSVDDLTNNRDFTEERNLTDTDKQDNHLYGNIGVTTSQQMLESEIKLRNDYNIYQFIALKFYDDFMLKVI